MMRFNIHIYYTISVGLSRDLRSTVSNMSRQTNLMTNTRPVKFLRKTFLLNGHGLLIGSTASTDILTFSLANKMELPGGHSNVI